MTEGRALIEHEARQVLADKHSQAASRDLFSARREESGWVFAWSDRTTPAPMGVGSVVVTDSGQVGRLKIGETAEQAFQRLSD
ncbi:hypothetical protein [Propionicicella superfundia]|uniref:hypothetical protein n=1 Tax=Propionicicella superfundia TaxID=348582 RepID=UPI00041694FF|nr:hypothetical protein [Propionicicella superfundia]